MFKKVKVILSNVTVEPLLFLTIMADMIYKLVTQNLYMEKACRVSLQMNLTTCDAMSKRNRSGYTNLEEIEVQKLSSGMLAIASALHSLFPLILALFLGSWSDRHNKRKPIIMAPPVGLLLTMCLLILNVIYFNELPIITTVISDALLFPLLGGLPCLFLGVYSFVGIVSRDENKTIRMGIVTTAQSLSMVLGLGISGFVYNYFGFIKTYGLCAVLIATGIICGYFLIEDVEVKNNKVQQISSKKSFICDVFDVRYVIKSFKVCFGTKINNRRNKVLSLMVLGMITGGPPMAEFAVSYLYSRYRYGWSVTQYSSYSFFHFISGSFASVISLAVFSKWLKWEDATLGIIGITSSIIGTLLSAFAKSGEIFFLGGVVDCFMVCAHISLRSMMAKVVEPNELGQINSLFGVFQAASHFIFIPLYGMIYRTTISFFPGTFYLVSVGVKCIGLFIFIFLYFTTRQTKLKINKGGTEQITEYTKCEVILKTSA